MKNASFISFHNTSTMVDKSFKSYWQIYHGRST